jgi:hypothetical protein
LIRFFTNRELSGKLGINLAKWKRWSREFLPPDPLGGLQSGFARQYRIDDAFTVFLGGHLVTDLKYTVPEARTILRDLQTWLKRDFLELQDQGAPKFKGDPNQRVGSYVIFIARQPAALEPPAGFYYTVRGIISNRSLKNKDTRVREERYVDTLIPARDNQKNIFDLTSIRMLNISAVVNLFVESLELS